MALNKFNGSGIGILWELHVGLLLDVSLETVLNFGYENEHLWWVTKCLLIDIGLTWCRMAVYHHHLQKLSCGTLLANYSYFLLTNFGSINKVY